MVIMMSDPMDPARQHGVQPQSVSPEMLQDIEEFLKDGRLGSTEMVCRWAA